MATDQDEPETAEPTSAEPTSAEPTSAEPISAEPTSAEPTSAEPTSAEPTSAEPTSAEPARLGTGILWWSIGVTALCFLPLGLVAVAYSLRALRALGQAGGSGPANVALAQRCWRVARRWAIAAAVVGLLVDLFILAVLMLLGAFATGPAQAPG